MNRMHHFVLAAALISGHAFAATKAAVAADGPKAPVVLKETRGSTVVVGQDSAMGLTLMPWKEEFASGLDQAPTLYRAPPEAVSGESLQRQTEYRDNLNNYRRSHSQYTQ